MTGNGCVVVGLRQGSANRRIAFMAGYWNAATWNFRTNTDMSGVTISKTANSKSFNIITEDTGVIPLIIIGGVVTAEAANS